MSTPLHYTWRKRRARAPVPLLVLLPLLFAPGARAESIQERFDRGRLEFGYKNFGNAIAILTPLLKPEVRLTREDDIVAAYEMLGLSHFYTGEEDEAREMFTQLLYIRPEHRLDPFLVPPPAVAFFDRIRNDPALKAKLEKIERERRAREQAEARKPPRTVVRRIYLQRDRQVNQWWLTLVPFGAGQFQNDHVTKGVLLAVGEGVALSTNIVCYLLLDALAKDNGKYASEDLELARGLQVTQYVSLGVFTAAVIYGIIDANVYYQPVVRGTYRKTREETDEQDTDPAAVVPMAVPGGAGLGLSMRF